jgi:Tol biopolymer transport system component
MQKGRLAFLASMLVGLVVAVPAQAAFPGKPGPLVYSKTSAEEGAGGFEEGGGIFSHGPRRRDRPQQLTDDTDDSAPSVSPNGRLIAFSSNREAPGPLAVGRHIFVMKRDGSAVTQLTSGAFYDSNPSFSPNGRQIVFDRGAAALSPVTHIFSVAVDGSGLRQISDGPGSDYDPVFSPNGRVIVFASSRRPSGRKDRSNIFSMRPNGTRVRLLIGGPRSEYEPDISPNGRRIAFASNRSGSNLFIARINGRHVRALTHRRDCLRGGCYSSPAWAPDGRHIAYLSTGTYSSSVDVMRADGRGFSREFDSGGTEEEGFGTTIGPPSWGPRPR